MSDRIALKQNDVCELIEETIIRACCTEQRNGEEICYSTFYVSRFVWSRIYERRLRSQQPLELTAKGYRMILVTAAGPVYVMADPSFTNEEHDGSNRLEVEWGSGLTYDDCIEQGEAWMQLAVKLRGY